MGMDHRFFVFNPKTGPEILGQIDHIGDQIALNKSDNRNWISVNEIWKLFETCLLDGTLVIPGRKDGAVCPKKVHGYLVLLDEYFEELTSKCLFDCGYNTSYLGDFFEGFKIGEWAKHCWVFEGIERGDKVSSSEHYGELGLPALDVLFRSGYLELNNISELSEEQIQLWIQYDKKNPYLNVTLGLSQFPDTLLKLVNHKVRFAKPIEISVESAKEILKSGCDNFQFPYGSSNPASSHLLEEICQKQTLSLGALKSMERDMFSYFRQRMIEENRERAEFGDPLLKIEELISDEGGDWIDEKRDLPVYYVADDAMDRIRQLGISFWNELDIKETPQSKNELTLKDAINHFSEYSWSGVELIDSGQLKKADNYYWLLRNRMEKSKDFDGYIPMEEYLSQDSCIHDYNCTAVQDEKFLEAAKQALQQGKIVCYWSD